MLAPGLGFPCSPTSVMCSTVDNSERDDKQCHSSHRINCLMRYQSECVPKTFCSRAQQARTVYFFICLAGREHSSRKTSVVGDTHRLISCKNDHCFWACLHPAQQTFAMSKADKKKVSRGLLTRDTHRKKKKKCHGHVAHTVWKHSLRNNHFCNAHSISVVAML